MALNFPLKHNLVLARDEHTGDWRLYPPESAIVAGSREPQPLASGTARRTQTAGVCEDGVYRSTTWDRPNENDYLLAELKYEQSLGVRETRETDRALMAHVAMQSDPAFNPHDAPTNLGRYVFETNGEVKIEITARARHEGGSLVAPAPIAEQVRLPRDDDGMPNRYDAYPIGRENVDKLEEVLEEVGPLQLLEAIEILCDERSPPPSSKFWSYLADRLYTLRHDHKVREAGKVLTEARLAREKQR